MGGQEAGGLTVQNGDRVKKIALGGLLLLSLLGLARAEGNGPPPPKLKDVKVWYYPPSGKPVPLIWWQPGKLPVSNRHFRFDRRGRFRTRVEMEGGFMKDGRMVNFVTIAFRDTNSNMFQLPVTQSLVEGPVKDVFWSPPTHFASGDMDFQVALWNDVLPKVSLETDIVDRTDFLMLGRLDPPR